LRNSIDNGSLVTVQVSEHGISHMQWCSWVLFFRCCVVYQVASLSAAALSTWFRHWFRTACNTAV